MVEATPDTSVERETATDTDTDTDIATKPSADLDEIAASADLVRVYLNEIGKVALLTAADEVD
ncbi:MAG: Sigma-70 factor, region 1, partial [Pseudonocardiales bacterium]|nr:Sigma-70 factor, region 1 [Pseudonocardiales bacterium]